MNEFKGKTEEAVSTLKQDVADIKKDISTMKKQYWVLIVAIVVVLFVKAPEVANIIVGKLLAFGG